MGLPQSNEVELDALLRGSLFEDPRLEFRPMINGDGAWAWSALEHSIQHSIDDFTGHPKPSLQDRTGATLVIDHGENPIRVTVSEGIINEIHPPTLPWTTSYRRGSVPARF
jgi:hypothetical protein